MTDKPIPGHGGWQKPVQRPSGPPPLGLPPMRGCTCHDPRHHPDPNCRECKHIRDRFEVGYQ